MSMLCYLQDSVPPGSAEGPRSLMQWSETIYKPLFDKILNADSNFKLRENDYVFGNLKFGGNAQSISRDRFVHHTSFLWNYSPHNMQYLTKPPKQPEYRQNRDHTEFLTSLSAHLKCPRDELEKQFQHHLSTMFDVTEVDYKDICSVVEGDYRKSNVWVGI
jgi:lipoate-protein ligase A